MTDSSKTAGLILAGGKSQRFGAEKAMALFRGQPMIETVAERLADCQRIAVSAPRDSGAAAFARANGYELIEDDARAPHGPLAGICAALEWAVEHDFDMLATAPCDTPLLPDGLYAVLSAALAGGPAAFATTASGDHALCAIWRTELLAPLRITLASGEHPPIRAFLLANEARRVLFEDETAFANANTPEELDRLAERAPGF